METAKSPQGASGSSSFLFSKLSLLLFLVQEGKAAFSLTFPCGGGQCEARQASGSTLAWRPIFLYPLPARAREASSGALLLSSGLDS